VIGEPTELKPVLGHKGKLAMRCQVHGAACHSAYAPAGVNAIEYAARLVSEWVRLGETLKAPEHLDARFDPAFSTVQTGLISGGKALNIVPQDCSFDFEVRSLPAQDPWQVVQQLRDYAEYSLLPAMRAVSAQSAISISELSSYPGLATAPESQAAEWVAQFCGSQDFGTVAFGTEGGLFDQAGIPTVVCGPGSMEQGHKPDEFISLAQLQACDRMLARVLKFVSV
jgi:acetylornithine deacetylase